MKKLAIIGAGELGLQIMELIKESTEKFNLVGFYDDYCTKGDMFSQGHLILGDLNDVQNDFDQGVFEQLFIAIGYKHLQEKKAIFERFSTNIPFAIIIHQASIVHKSVKIGQGVAVYPGCIIDKNVIIRDNVLLNLGVVLSHDSEFHSHSFFAPRVVVSGFVVIDELCFIGTGAVINDNLKIESNVTIGAGSVVIRSLKKNKTYVGNPAKEIKYDTLQQTLPYR